MKLKTRTLYSSILSAILVFLGFSGCSDPVDEYGCPMTGYKVIGKIVSDEQTDQGIGHIQVVMIQDVKGKEPTTELRGDTILTDSQGRFKFSSFHIPHPNQLLKIKDIDGEKNGSFNDREVSWSFSEKEMAEVSKTGNLEKDLGSISLNPKKEEPTE